MATGPVDIRVVKWLPVGGERSRTPTARVGIRAIARGLDGQQQRLASVAAPASHDVALLLPAARAIAHQRRLLGQPDVAPSLFEQAPDHVQHRSALLRVLVRLTE